MSKLDSVSYMTEESPENPPGNAVGTTPEIDASVSDSAVIVRSPLDRIPRDANIVNGQQADHTPGAASPPYQLSLRDRLVAASLVTIIVLFFLFTPWPLQEKLRTIGHACCAQIPSHTIRFDGQPMPIDARNSGIYSAVFMVIAIVWLTGRGKAVLFVPARIRNVLLLLVVAMVFDGFNSLAHTYNLRSYYPANNTIRTITGTLAGMALTILALPLFNRLTWNKGDKIAIADDFTDLVGYFGGAVLIIITLQQAPSPLYYPMSVLSVAGLLLMLTLLNMSIALISVRREKRIANIGMLITPALWGLVLTCFEILAIDYWRAFHG